MNTVKIIMVGVRLFSYFVRLNTNAIVPIQIAIGKTYGIVTAKIQNNKESIHITIAFTINQINSIDNKQPK